MLCVNRDIIMNLLFSRFERSCVGRWVLGKSMEYALFELSKLAARLTCYGRKSASFARNMQLNVLLIYLVE